LFGALETDVQRQNRLCELNVIEQVVNVAQTTAVRDAWERGQQLAVHGWVYDIHDGLLQDGISVSADAELPTRLEAARQARAKA
jgi:carbonic anhydrase